jgi:hypothetical protein
MATPTAASRYLPAREVQSGTAVAARAARGLGGVGRSLPRETRLYEGGPNQIIEMLAKELIPAYAGADPAGSPGSRPSIWRTSVRLGLNVGSGLEPGSKAYVANHQ